MIGRPRWPYSHRTSSQLGALAGYGKSHFLVTYRTTVPGIPYGRYGISRLLTLENVRYGGRLPYLAQKSVRYLPRTGKLSDSSRPYLPRTSKGLGLLPADHRSPENCLVRCARCTGFTRPCEPVRFRVAIVSPTRETW